MNGAVKPPSSGGFVLRAIDPKVPITHRRTDQSAEMGRTRAGGDVLAEMSARYAGALRRDQLALLQMPDHLDHQSEQHLLLDLRETGYYRRETPGP